MPPSFGQLAQLVEQRIENPRVRGSIPRLATSFLKTPALTGWRFCFQVLRSPLHSLAGGCLPVVFSVATSGGESGCWRQEGLRAGLSSLLQQKVR